MYLEVFHAGCVLQQLCFTHWKAPDYNQLCRGTPGSFVDYGWCIISSPLAKLLIDGVMSRAAPPRLAATDTRAAHQLKAACVAQIAVFVTSGSVVCALWWLSLRAVPTLTQGFHQALLQSTLAATGSSDVQETASRAASVLLSAESESLATQEGDTKSLPNHLLSPALWSNAGLARNQVAWFEHGRAVTGGPESSGTVPLLSNGGLLSASVYTRWKSDLQNRNQCHMNEITNWIKADVHNDNTHLQNNHGFNHEEVTVI